MDGIESRRPGTSSRAPRWLAATLAVLSVLTALALSPSAGAAAATAHTLSFAGIRVQVPAGWPVIDLRRDPSACVRFDRHAVYLGRPSARAKCPGHLAGRTEAILVERASSSGSGLGRGAPARLVRRTRGAEVFATWRTGAATILHAVGVRTLPAATPPHPARGRHAARAAADRASASTGARAKAAAAGPGQIYTGPGFDACSAPSQAQMNAWASSPYRALGVYVGGANMACAQTNLTPTWLASQAQAGWHVIPTYVGLQAPGNTCGCAAIQPADAASEGVAAAQDAITQAEGLGIGPGNPIYFDMEAYPRTSSNTTPVLSFLAAWTQTLHGSGYVSGVYSSENSGIADLIAQWGTSYQEPDEVWVANWNNQQSTADSSMPTTDWASHQRIHQSSGAHDETYGGTTLNIDGDYLDGLTAAASAAAPAAVPATPPALGVAPQADGSITLTPSWSGGPAVADWQILAGGTPSTMATISAPVSAASTTTVVVRSAYPYFAVEALDSSGTILGTSPVVTTPPHLTLAGASAFVPASGTGAVPITCFNTTGCHVSARVMSGHATLALTRTVALSPGAALLHFSLSRSARRALMKSRHQAVLVRLRDSAGMTATKAMTLQEFRTSGASPARSSQPVASVAVTGLTDYVSNGWVGGLLTSCRATTPCHIATTVTVGHTTISRTGQEYLGAGELGYLVFTLTSQGHALLAAAHGNQLTAQVTTVNGSDTATATVVLIAFP